MDYFDTLRSATPARLQIGSAGCRYKTKSYLDFRGAHAAAVDAVMSEVSGETLQKLGLSEFQTKCKNKYEMLTRPDFGRCFTDETKTRLKNFADVGRTCRFIAATGFLHRPLGPMSAICSR